MCVSPLCLSSLLSISCPVIVSRLVLSKLVSSCLVYSDYLLSYLLFFLQSSFRSILTLQFNFFLYHLNFLYSLFLRPLSYTLYVYYILFSPFQTLLLSTVFLRFCEFSLSRLQQRIATHVLTRTYAVVLSVFIHPIHFLTALSFARVAYIIKERQFNILVFLIFQFSDFFLSTSGVWLSFL